MATYLLYYKKDGFTQIYKTGSPVTKRSSYLSDLKEVNRYSSGKDLKIIAPIDVVYDTIDFKLRTDFITGNPGNYKLNRLDSDTGAVQDLRGNKALLNNWDKIIPVAFEFYTNLLFTKKPGTNGQISCEIYRYLPSRQSHKEFNDENVDRGQGNFLFLRSFQAPSCTHIIQGTFGGEYGGLFFWKG